MFTSRQGQAAAWAAASGSLAAPGRPADQPIRPGRDRPGAGIRPRARAFRILAFPTRLRYRFRRYQRLET